MCPPECGNVLSDEYLVHGKEFEQTKRQVVRRLYQVLENRAFERMFSHPA